MQHRLLMGAAALWVGTAFAVPVAAQVTGTIGEPMVPIRDDRGRNVSVTQRARDNKDYKPLGIRAGGFTVLPTVEIRPGYTDNVYQVDGNRQSDAFVSINPGVVVRSNWSVHSLGVSAGGRLTRYAEAKARNEDGWFIGTDGRVDVSRELALNLGIRTARQYESRFSGDAINQTREANPYQATIAKGSAVYQGARTRIVAAGEYSSYNFFTVQGFDGAIINQDNRDRDVYRGALHAEYALTPDTAVFGEVQYTDTGYRVPLGTRPNRESGETRAVAGLSMDVSNLLRGSLAIGYIDRNYSAPIYNDISGLTFNGRLEYFFSGLTTFTLAVRREIEDSTAIGSSGFFNSGATLRVDHELLRNLILNVSAEIEQDDYRGIDAKNDVYRLNGGARYMLDNRFGLTFNTTYMNRSVGGATPVGFDLSEFRATIGLTVQR